MDDNLLLLQGKNTDLFSFLTNPQVHSNLHLCHLGHLDFWRSFCEWPPPPIIPTSILAYWPPFCFFIRQNSGLFFFPNQSANPFQPSFLYVSKGYLGYLAVVPCATISTNHPASSNPVIDHLFSSTFLTLFLPIQSANPFHPYFYKSP